MSEIGKIPATSTDTSQKVLVVDDSAVERNMFTYMLQRWGYNVTAASSGEEAIEIVKREKIQLVLGDWHMSGMDGMEMVSHIRELDLGFYVYIIMVSAQRAEEFLISALAVGADDMLTKPVDANELEARLQSATRRIALQESLIAQNRKLSEAHDLIAQDLSAVSRVQRSYLPDPVSRFAGLHYEWLSQPSQYVSGDHLQVFRLTDEVCGFYLLDVSGHGIPAAVKSMQLTQMFTDMSTSSVLFDTSRGGQSKQIASPSQVVGKLNELFQQTDSDLSYFTLLFGHFYLETGRVVMCQAGHPSPLVIRQGGEVEAIGGGGYPVGLFDFNEFEDTELSLGIGDSLLIYSDGVTEVVNDTGEQFGQDRLIRTVTTDWKRKSSDQLGPSVLQAVKQWGGKDVYAHGFEDDISLLMLMRTDKDALAQEPPELLLPSQQKEISQSQVFRSVILNADEDDDDYTEQRKRPVLIVDDSRSFLRIFEAMLNSWGYDVRAAQSGAEALDIIKEFEPDFVLTDWDMPGMSGIELCEQVRKNDTQSHTYVIMITGYASREQLLYSLMVGADDFLTKPVSPNELKVRLHAAERIFSLHGKLELQNAQLSRLYGALQRDMREVSRIQRALLPKSISSPWPVAIQTLYQPMGYVCGKQIGTLQTNSNEIGFFMLSLPGRDTSSALQAMSLSRWFSISRATQLLFPMEAASERGLRYLADPATVWQQVRDLTHSLTALPVQFELVYGLLNLKQGRLLVAGVGDWQLTLLQPSAGLEVISVIGPQAKPSSVEASDASDALPMRVLFEGVIDPGTRFYLSDGSTTRALSLTEESTWSKTLQDTSAGLRNDFYQISASGSSPSESERVRELGADEDLALMGFQWREYFEPRQWDLSPAERQALIEELVAMVVRGEGVLKMTPDPLTLGECARVAGFEAVSDNANISKGCAYLESFIEAAAYGVKLQAYASLALSEAMTNVMNHGFGFSKPEPLQLYFMQYEKGLVVLMRDKGNPIPDAVLSNIKLSMDYAESLDVYDLPEGGMGLTFISMVSKAFAYVSHDGWNDTWMIIADEPDGDE